MNFPLHPRLAFIRCTLLVASALSLHPLATTAATVTTPAAHQMENLGRGVVAIHQPDGKIAVRALWYWSMMFSCGAVAAFRMRQ